MNIPSYYSSKYYEDAQKNLMPYGQGLLQGNVPEYYKGIGEYGGPLLDEYTRRVERDVSRGVTEDLARRGIRGERGAGIIAGKVGDISSALNWQDYVRAMTGRENLMKTGLGVMGDVRSAGLSESSLRNEYGLNKARLELSDEQFQEQMAWQKEQQEQQQEQAMWDSLLSGGIGAIGNVVGMGMLGGLGGILGSAAGGGGSANKDYFSNISMSDLGW